jgi:predicted esterase
MSRWLRGLGAAALVSGLAACAGAPRPRPAEAESEAETSGADEGLRPLASEPMVALAVERHHPAVVSVPVGATSPKPVLVAAHGAGDRPEWHCAMWRETVGNGAFVLCPRGFPTNAYVPPEDAGYFYASHHGLGREISLALEALAARFPEHADVRAPVFAGFSQGAIMGALLLPYHPARFSRAVLIEGGAGLYQEWSVAVALRWRRAGGARALLACGGSRCAETARESARWLDKGGIDARVLHVEGAGHTYGGDMEARVREAFSWVTEGDPRWQAR